MLDAKIFAELFCGVPGSVQYCTFLYLGMCTKDGSVRLILGICLSLGGGKALLRRSTQVVPAHGGSVDRALLALLSG